MYARTKLRESDDQLANDKPATTATAYNQAGDDYLQYADGGSASLYAFDSLYAYADRQVWDRIEQYLVDRWVAGARSINILDAGCGPGTWLRRLVSRAHDLGFEIITARGFDIAEAQVRRARLLSRDLAALSGVTMTFDVGSLDEPLPEHDATVDLCLCLYGVLNHLPVAKLPGILSEFSRVTSGCFVGTVRTAGSRPTIFVDALEHARDFKQDNDQDRCEVEMVNGRHIAFDCHLFTADELRQLAAEHFDIEEFRGLDLFCSRFAPDPRWNPPSQRIEGPLAKELARLEEAYAADPDFMDRAAHLLIVCRPWGYGNIPS